ncbi:asparagine synthase (glutamine-hydrolyzing) [Haloglycomyces albus]|uniref:asparagine synthase (glutamine-hydrolyzing) n=1 Tax=Haloglycomyces albus TaxID=526067 RepID=UPI0004AD68CC|nr:asparagine synthase (glutamine-hydrolyzing) [Haloglycomyces albus]
MVKIGRNAPNDRVRFEENLGLIHHRGPDETDVKETADTVLWGFQRLSIIDVDTSHQPMTRGDGKYTITFNGEIYNYVELREELMERHGLEFETKGDTEVILAGYEAWGPDVLQRLRGMFAFVIYDRDANLMFVARDQFGIKPLYWTYEDSDIWFSSEKKALPGRGSRDDVDPRQVGHYVTYQYPPEPGTMHSSIRRLEAGHYALFRPGAEMRPQRYFRPMFHPKPVGNVEALHEEIAEALRDSVRMHMRSDVPVGALLSSGIDSNAIVALSREINPDILTFTAFFDGLDADPNLPDELTVAQQSASELGVRNIPAPVTFQNVMAELPRIVWHLDDPVADPAIVPLYFVTKTAAENVTVALGGEGADELFGGYTIYREPHSLKSISKLPSGAKNILNRASHALPSGVKGKSFLERGTMELEDRFIGNAKIFTGAEKEGILRSPAEHYRSVTDELWEETAHLDPTSRMQYVDLHTWMRGDILVKADRMSMAHSLEVRVPFLDKRVWEIAERIPVEHRLQGGQTKVALRQAVKRIVPPAIVERPKMGFPTPYRQWLAGPMFDWVDQLFAQSQAGHLLNLDYARQMLRDHREGNGDHARKVWTVMIFCIWYSQLDARAAGQDAHEPAVM